MSSMNFHNCDFSLSRAINIVQSSNITIENLHITDSQANNNNLVHISLSKDLNFENITAHNITKNSPVMVALFNVIQLQSWGQNGNIMKYTVQNLNFSQSAISVLHIETYQPLEKESAIVISFQNITIQNINIKGKEALFQFKPTNQTKLSFTLNESVITNNYLELGYMIDLRQNSNKISITNTYFFNNSGMIMKTQPYEMNDLNQSLTVKIFQTRFFKNWANQSLFHISANSLLTIQNSSFEENFSLGRGSIIFSEFYLSRISISQSIFKKNYALTGGVFFSTLNGFIEVDSSSFIENFALSGGVYYSQNEGYALLRNSSFTQNLALKGSLIYAINCFNPITVSGGLISRNGFQYHPKFQKPETFNLKFNSMGPLLNYYFNQIYIKKITQVLSTDNNIFIKYLQDNERSHQISIVKAYVKLSDKILITEQDLLIIAQSNSTIEIIQATYQNSKNQNETIFIEQSNLVLNSLTIQNISSSAPIFQIESDSIMTSTKLHFHNCFSSLLKIQKSRCFFDELNAQEISLNKNKEQKYKQLITMLYSQVNFTNTVLLDINNLTNVGTESENMNESQINQDQKREKIVLYAKKTILSIINLNASEFNGHLIFLESGSQLNFSFSEISNGKLNRDQGYSTVITLLDSSGVIESSSFNDISGLSGSVIQAQNFLLTYFKTSLFVENSTFRRIYSTQKDGGGSIQITNIDAFLVNNKFIQNLASLGSGGALRLLCSVQNQRKCRFNVEKNSFEENSALNSGGAIYYDLYSPYALADNKFAHNTANYGASIGSYAFKLKISNNSDNNLLKLNSGEITQEVLSIGIYDQQGQLLKNDHTSEAVLYTSDIENLQIVGNTKAIASKGIFIFKNIKYLARPNFNTSIQISSNIINKAACSQVTGSQCADLQLNVNFRPCKMGEVQLNNICEPCAKGYFSFNTKDKLCQRCISNLICNGKNNTMVYPGFWRSSPTSLKIYQCPKHDSCEGGLDSKCKLGYKGRMCNECNRNAPDGKIYGKTGAFTCQICPNIGVQFIQTLAVIAVITFYIIYLLNSVLQNPRRNKPQTVLIRILTNYFQAIMIVKEFDLAWPKQVSEMLKVFQFFSSSQEMIISLDCYLNNSYLAYSMNFFPTFYLKVLLFGISPIIFGFLSSLAWMVIQFLLKKFKNRNIDLNLNIQATCFIIIFISYPTITTMSFSLFDCFQIDNDKYYLRMDFSIQCWTQQHIKMALSIGLPFILVWVIGFPSFIMYKLYQNKKNLNNQDFISRYGLFFIGLNDNSYFWEVTIQNGRKILFILYNLFLSASQSNTKALLGILTLFLQSLILGRLNPFIDPRFNQVDIQAQYAAIYTLFCGMFFVQEQVQKNNDAIFVLFIIVLGYNVFFLAFWLFRFGSVLLRVNIDKLRQYQACIWLKHVKMLSYEEDLDLYVKESNIELSCSMDRQFEIQNQRMLKYVVPSSKKLSINHHDLLNLPKKPYRNGIKKKGDYKKKRRGSKEQTHVVKGLSPLFPPKRTNVDIFSKIVNEEQSFGLHNSQVPQAHPQKLKQINDSSFPFL